MNGDTPAAAFFGGSFDPIHRGHLYIADVVHTSTSFSSILFVPNRINPLKNYSPAASGVDRLRMIECAIADYTWCRVDSDEIDFSGPSYTVDTVERLIVRKRLVERPGLIIGDDLVDQVSGWHEAEKLLRIVVPVVVRRHTERSIEQRTLPTAFPHDTVIVYNEQIPVSSTEVRNRIRSGLSIKELVPPEVYEYIQRYQPYNRSD